MQHDARGYFTMVLHAHLPFVREPAHEQFLEEGWLHEALIETYLPLLAGFETLVRDGVDFRLAVTLTPTLIAMLDDELLRERFDRRLGDLVELAEKETRRLADRPDELAIARFYHERLLGLHELYREHCQRDVVGAFRRLQDLGRIEVITCAATHGFLPLLRHQPGSVRAQVQVAVDQHRERFGRAPEGIWLPECGYYPGLDEALAEAGLRYFFVESHAILHGSDRPNYGVYAPVVCPSGVAAFARDPECAKQVWSVEEGFPGAPDYREFYRDIGFDLPLDYVGPYLGEDGVRRATGIKYHRVTGRTEEKGLYVRELAMQQAAEHAATFLAWRHAQVAWLAERMDRRPIIVAPYDAELFGHWWFEGPDWIRFLLRKIAFEQSEVATATPSEYLAEYPTAQISTPAASSWGDGGYNDVWLNESNDWIVPRLLGAAGDMERVAHRHRGASGLTRRALDQAGRELLLAEASDWAFIIRNDTATEFARRRIDTHLSRFDELVGAVRDGGADAPALSVERLEEIEKHDNLFPALGFEVFADRRPRPPYAMVGAPRHVAFLTAEAAPLVKVGGLADVASALPPALAEWGMQVTVILPGYRTIDRDKFEVRPALSGLEAYVGDRRVPFSLAEARSPADGVRIFLVEEEGYFGRDGVYVDPATDEEYPDSGERFVFFTRAGLEALRALGEPVDIVHAHDHQTALAPALLQLHYRDDPLLGLAASVYTLHNLGYQGVYGPEILTLAGVGDQPFSPGSPFEHYGYVNFMKVGIEFADRVNTVSENYAREICADEVLGAGLGGVLRARGADFQGILNGIDPDEWNPQEDPHLPASYGVDDVSGKRIVKEKLFEVAGLDPARIERPLVGIVSRLVDQKGFDIVAEALARILELDTSIVVLGTGLPKYQDLFRLAAEDFPGQVAALIKFDNGLAHLIEGGADMFLMPSLYEPCGLNQMYSLRYGTVPIVRATGGLADTVTDDDAAAGTGVGFSFHDYNAGALFDAVLRAVRAYEDPERWRQLQRRGMSRDLSWGASALRYRDLYVAALRGRTR